MLEVLWYAPVSEQQCDHEDVIHREREFDNVTCDEFIGVLAVPGGDHGRCQGQPEQHGQGEPDRSPGQRLLQTNDMSLAMENTEIEREEEEDRHDENEPGEERGGGRGRHREETWKG